MKKMNKTLAIAIAAALVSPSAFAAQDTSGMQYTSASEGFYASLRARLDFNTYDSSADTEGNASIAANSSRIGIRGTNDLGGGLSGFYQWEGEVNIDDSDRPAIWRARLGHVGLRGSFGEVVVGAFWTADYSFTHGGTDVANNYSGWLTYNDQRESRSEKAVQYTTPDLNGFQGAIRVDVGTENTTVMPDRMVDGEAAPSLAANTSANGLGAVTGTHLGRSDNDIDGWNIAAKYEIQGFSAGASYNNLPERLAKVDDNGDTTGYEDGTSWTIKSGYAQDNWYVNGWYGEDNISDNGVASSEDTEYFSIAGGVAVDKVNLYVVYDTVTANADGMGGKDSAYTTVGAQYNLGSNSRVWLEYFGRDVDSADNEADTVSIGLRHDF